jgi:SHS2 domain-containing protein
MVYELLEHTGDLGLLVKADEVNGLFCEAGRALFDVITDIAAVEPRVEHQVSVAGNGLDECLVAWLNELLYLHETEELLFAEFAVHTIHASGVVGVGRGERFDATRHRIERGVKAATFHQLEVRKDENGWNARIILDV